MINYVFFALIKKSGMSKIIKFKVYFNHIRHYWLHVDNVAPTRNHGVMIEYMNQIGIWIAMCHHA